MILVDTNVWIHHLHVGEPQLVELLMADQICCHELVLTELALGSLRSRTKFLSSLEQLKRLPRLEDEHVRWFVEKRELWGCGLSAVDAHLLASIVAAPNTLLWTRDKRLHQAAEQLGKHFVAM